MSNIYNVIIAGVGGQGSLLASRIVGAVLLSSYADVKVSEVHGMSQRGGSVVTYVRAGEIVYSPVVPYGECDLLIAFEQLEALRWAGHVRREGYITLSDRRTSPMPVVIGASKYPDDVSERLALYNHIIVPADDLAHEAGLERASNIALLGVASRFTPLDAEVWREEIRRNVKSQFADINLKAFELGRAYKQNSGSDNLDMVKKRDAGTPRTGGCTV